jgi:hypothetical protein
LNVPKDGLDREGLVGLPERGNRVTRQIAAILVGATFYVAAGFARADLLPRIATGISGHWANSLDTFLTYITSLLAGFVAALVFRHQVLATGFCASALGSLARTLLKLFITLHAVGWLEIRHLPLGFVGDLVFAAFGSGVLGAAGGAVAAVAVRSREA